MATYLSYPFDEELFMYQWGIEPDPVKNAFVTSGVLSENAEIAAKIAGGSNYYTIPFYNTLKDPSASAPVNYDGQTNITTEETAGDEQSGVVFWRAKAWTARDFIPTFNSGADPMGSIVAQNGRYWDKYHQNCILNLLTATFGVTSCTASKLDSSEQAAWVTAWGNHTYDISASSSVTDANKMDETTIAAAAQKACGDNATGLFSLAFMDSTVALNLAKKDLLEYRKYTDGMGIQRTLNIADIDGYTVIVDDALDNGDGTHTSYLLGQGSIQYAPAPVKVPVEVEREARVNGGQDTLITRIGRTYHVNGFDFTKPSGMTASPTDAQLYAAANYALKFDPKAIGLSKVVTNG